MSWHRESSTRLNTGFGYGKGACMDSEQPVTDIELIVTDMGGPHAIGVTTDNGQRYLVVDSTFPKNNRGAREAFFRTYQKMTCAAAA